MRAGAGVWVDGKLDETSSSITEVLGYVTLGGRPRLGGIAV